ncbi:DUF6968 family protein [Leptospira santarosai]|uniref:DUF6968 family protein n=1 Tax=Leptospira santarosai TaxID=28183 RepID=UPI0002BD35C7|nr:hypothetical protein [Leptospira santarosai]EMO73581.1 hypothetical protein LEP1GSC130_2686 [Leptospira santarosai str. 200403458]EMP00461.1 hypothetical protein LEP1GSC120_3461 [Leptospira santarosai str. 200702252]MDI7216301.1 hypothetical protein [Leptospira santarosai]
MKQQYKLGTVIAERKLSLKVGRKKQTVLIRIGKPKISNDPKMDWYCPFQISKIGLDTIKAAHGIDSIQALLLAMKMIEAILVHFQKSNPGKLDLAQSRISRFSFTRNFRNKSQKRTSLA